MSGLQKIDEKQIKEAIAAQYHVYPAEDVCLYHDYEFIRRGDDKVRHDFIYGIIDERCKKPFTNYDRIRAKSDKELAEWIESIVACCRCLVSGGCNGEDNTSAGSCMLRWLDWLKSPVAEEELTYEVGEK